MHSVWVHICLTLLSKVLSRTKPNSWSLTKLRSFFPALMMVTMTSWRMASSGSWERTFRYSGWIKKRKTCNQNTVQRIMCKKWLNWRGEEKWTKTKTQVKTNLSGLWPGLGGSWGSGWQTLHTLASLERGCHWTWRKKSVTHKINSTESCIILWESRWRNKWLMDKLQIKCLKETKRMFYYSSLNMHTPCVIYSVNWL